MGMGLLGVTSAGAGAGGIGATSGSREAGRGRLGDLRADPSSLGVAPAEVNPNRQRATLTAVTFAEQ